MPHRRRLSPPARRRLGRGTALRVGLVMTLSSMIPLTSCAGALNIDPAPQATATGCTSLVAELPATVAGLARRGTGDTPGVAAWGDPAVVLRCGTEQPGPTTDPCLSAEGVDWVELAADEAGASLLAAYGRVPGIQVEVPAGSPPGEVLVDLAPAVSALPQDRACS